MSFNMSAILAFTTKGLSDNLSKGSAQFKSYKDSMRSAGQQSQTLAKGVGRVALAGTLLAGGIGLAVNSHMDFEKQMAAVTSKMKDGKENYMALEEEAKRLGASTVFTAKEAAQGLEYLALAGFNAKDSIGVLPVILNTAAVGVLDLGRASDIVTDSMSALSPAFDKNASKAVRATRMADMMSLAQARTNTNIEQLGEAIKFGGGAMANMEIPLQEIIGSMGALANAGIKGSMGGTSLVNMMNKLAKPSSQAIALMDEMGISQKDLMDPKNPSKLKDMASVVKIFEDALKKQPDVLQRAGAASEIFGLRGQRAFFALANQGGDSLRELFGELDNSTGAADKMYKEMTDNLWGSVMSFKSASQGMMLEVGKMVAQQFNLKDSILGIASPVQQMATAFMALNKPAEKWSVIQKQAMDTPYGEIARGISLALSDVRVEMEALWIKAKEFFATTSSEKGNLENLSRSVAKIAIYLALAGPPVVALGLGFMFITPILKGVIAGFQLMGFAAKTTMLILRAMRIAVLFTSNSILMLATAQGRAILATKLEAFWTNHSTLAKIKDGIITRAKTLWTWAGIAAQKAQALWTGIVTAAQWAWNVAMTANPIGLVVVGIGILVAAIAGAALWIYKNRDAVVSWWNSLWSVDGTLTKVWGTITNFVAQSQVLGFVVNAVSGYIDIWKFALLGIWETGKLVIATFQEYGFVMGVVKLGQMAFAKASETVGLIGDWLVGKWQGVINIFQEAWAWIQKVTGSGIDKVMSFFGMKTDTNVPKTEVANNVIMAADKFQSVASSPLVGGGAPSAGGQLFSFDEAKKKKAATSVAEASIGAKAVQYGSPNISVQQPGFDLPTPEISVNVMNTFDEYGINSIVEKSNKQKANKKGKQTKGVVPEKQSQVSYGT